MTGHVFISHATVDDGWVAELVTALEARGIATWTDSRALAGGDRLRPEIERAIDEARHFLVVLGPETMNSEWVIDEVRQAQEVAKRRPEYQVVPLIRPGVAPAALKLWFGEAPLAVRLGAGPGALQAALPQILEALGEALPRDEAAAPPRVSSAFADLTLALSEPGFDAAGKPTARAELTYDPPAGTAPEQSSRAFSFTAPLGTPEFERIGWYLERSWGWPGSVVAEQQQEVARELPRWGRKLFDAALGVEKARAVLAAWSATPVAVERRFTVEVDESPLDDGDEEAVARAAEAGALLLALPWEILRDEEDYLFHGTRAVRVRRRIKNTKALPAIEIAAPLRVLLVSPRPEEENRVGYIDHRVSAWPLVEALAPLGDLAELTVLQPPTFAALQEELGRGSYHVVHFDGHGVFNRARKAGERDGFGALVFEHPDDEQALEDRRAEIVPADRMAALMRDRRVPLVFLEACQSAQAEDTVTSSVAGRLLAGGVGSVAAMSHSVLVETARRFVGVFYRRLAAGDRVGRAMLAGQQYLWTDPRRGETFYGEMELQDWFVPVLFQEEHDPHLVPAGTSVAVQADLEEARRRAFAWFPPQDHGFVGRSRELLAAERLLCRRGAAAPRYLVLVGEGGEGKTTVACELARWLVDSRRFERPAFVSVEHVPDARAVLWQIGEQLVAQFATRAAESNEAALQLVERALGEHPTILVVDNVESLLPERADGGYGAEPEVARAIFELLAGLARCGRTRLVLTSRERLPEPFATHHRPLGRLERRDAEELVKEVLRQEGTRGKELPKDQIDPLIEAVGGHARALVLIAKELRDRDLAPTKEAVDQILADLDRRFPGDRERSLLASVELSLRRLPPGMRTKLAPLAVFRSGGHLWVIATVLGLDVENGEAVELARELGAVRLAEPMAYGYLRFDPALSLALGKELGEEERATAEAAWQEAMAAFTDWLYKQKFGANPEVATALTVLDGANLVAALEARFQGAGEGDFEGVVETATSLEALLAAVNRPRALARVVEIREAAVGLLGGWSAARFNAESAAVDRLLEAGRFHEAGAAARLLVGRAVAAGEEAYSVAAYQIAEAHARLGRSLKNAGSAAAALEPLAEARRRFEVLATTGDQDAVRMASVCRTELGDCLQFLGRLEEAAEEYEAAIRLDEARGEVRDITVGKFNLGSVRLRQRRFDEALAAYEEARKTVEQLGEPELVAAAWHQIGMAHRKAGQPEAAERAYQESLRIKVQRRDRVGQAQSLGELGNLYSSTGRREDSVRAFRQAAGIFSEPGIGNLINEGRARYNAADDLVQLGRLDEARTELSRAIECSARFGHAAEPWKTYNLLTKLETAAGNSPAAAGARRHAISLYLTYRRDGGQSLVGGSTAQSCQTTRDAVHNGQTEAAGAELAELVGRPDLPPYLAPVLRALQAILAGSRDPSLAEVPALDYDDAAEIHLLLEQLAAAG